jgi:serine/threonine protein kinase
VAPEIHLHAPFDFRVDVYAFAMVMFMVLTGLTPFTNDTDQMVSSRLLNGDRSTIPDHVGAHCAELMRTVG